ncbi:histidine phosphatase family protein [Treponema denticola]|uniref:histidine phosphatase family protein n=1 Tax=Treponema denticola TaxID=158 RepID=UPI0020A4A054|nr:histidine phosphatase family protein [Treponema denticola]UTC81698.1 histidine phosphatase family protein [Treponema denticola]
MIVIYFIRHAQSDISIKENRNRPLTNKGKKDADKLKNIFREININSIISSPYLRSIQTMTPLSEMKNIQIELYEDLREKKSNVWFDRIEEFQEYVKKQWSDFNYSMNQDETLNEVQRRNINVLFNILNTKTGKTVLIGTHGTALCTILNYFDKKYGYEYFLEIAGKMPHIVKITFENNKAIEINEIQTYNRI